MDALKQYRKMRSAQAEYEDKTRRYGAELKSREGGQAALDEGALRAEVLGEPDARNKRGAADENAAKVKILRAEAAKAKRSAEILEEEIQKLVDGAVDELLAQYRPEMEKAYRVFIKTLREAAAAERRIEEIQNAAVAAAAESGLSRSINLEPTGSVRIGITNQVRLAEERARLNQYDAD